MSPESGRVPRQRRRGAIQVAIEVSDGHPMLTRSLGVLAVLGLVLAAAMAVFGLPPIDLHGPLHRLGIMDPLCGGTRSARLTAQGRIADAWTYNPLGIASVVACVIVVLRSSVGQLTGRWVNVRGRFTPRQVRLLLVLALLLAVALEVRQQLRADLLMTRA